MQIVIAGAGIGGLTLALMLHRRGIDCRIYESAQELRPLGVGINLLPHAVSELEQLGLLPALAECAIETSQLHYYNKFGQAIWREPRGLQAGYPLPQFSVHRGQFQMLLAQTVRERLGADAIVTGMALEAAEQDADGATAVFRRRADGSTQRVRGDILVGADGIHSALRRQLHPVGDEPRFSGRMLWRAVTEADPYLDGRSMFMAGHQDQKFVCYPISEPLRQQGRSLINWIAELSVPDAELSATDWNRQVDKSVFADRFANWRWDWIDIPAIIDGAQAIYEFPLVDRDPLPRWTRGRLTLLGDAAHPMYPIGSNGSAQAILDARCLSDWLAQAEKGSVRTPEIALLEYEAERLPRTAGIVLRNRLNGPEQVMQMAQERAPQGFADINDVIAQEELAAVSLRYKQLAGFDPAALQKNRGTVP
ncbi:MAG: flavin-dependent oxidoreductase [Achromobacter sp.]|uniref:FAD binding domain protein n=1 Tax=Achromobacter piechaudii ATCC 43553 TaxID=742159 RepID=D4X8Q7_9BURK|nr:MULTISPECIES: flavin-dependent oxidoreductase [Achromobacter]EFF76766.1 FAD binding domain protein [Achromobacter piechaudii ATCC 43553]MPS78821.1 flavin-dependent oxidoreductase [Achromobacter sp.]